MVTILDYGAGNVRSVINAVKSLDHEVKMVSTPEDIRAADQLIFPGVGNFGQMMAVLREKSYIQPLIEYLHADKPYLGICLGLHVLFDESEEAPDIPGLGVIPGKVIRFETNKSVPHIGWNGIKANQPSPTLDDLAGDEKFYFVHSYYVAPEDSGVTLTTTRYDRVFVSSIQRGNIVATQFHPEKSGKQGLQILRNFLDGAQPHKPSANNTDLAKRIVACLDVRSNDGGDLVVTKGDQYNVRERGKVRNLGKPVELARRYFEKGADEIVFLNITGFRDFPLEDMPMLEVLRQVSENVFVPLTIGGGIRDYRDTNGRQYTALEVAHEYFRSGADKISIGSDAVLIAEEFNRIGNTTGESSIEQIAKVYGSQAVVISIDPKRVYVASPKDTPHRVIQTDIPGPNGERWCWYQCTIKGGREARDIDAITLAKICEELGAGEILLNCIDRDGTNAGYDLELIRSVTDNISIPVIASSGAGCPDHFYDVFNTTTAEAALAAGIFHRREVSIQTVKDELRKKGVVVR